METRNRAGEPNRPPSIGLIQKYGFDSFVVGSSNKFAVDGVLAALGHSPIFIAGPWGSGKSHLLHALGNRARAKRAATRIVYLDAEALAQEVIRAVELHQLPEHRMQYSEGCDLLLIDDVQTIANRPSTTECIAHVFNATKVAGGQVVMTADRRPDQIPGLAGLWWRIQPCRLAVLDLPDEAMRIAILKQFATRIGILLDDDVAALLGASSSNVRDLEDCLRCLGELRVPLTTDLARRVLSDGGHER